MPSIIKGHSQQNNAKPILMYAALFLHTSIFPMIFFLNTFILSVETMLPSRRINELPLFTAILFTIFQFSIGYGLFWTSDFFLQFCWSSQHLLLWICDNKVDMVNKSWLHWICFLFLSHLIKCDRKKTRTMTNCFSFMPAHLFSGG